MAITAPVGRYNWMKVVDIMTRDPLTVTPVETIGQADELMNTNKIRQLPVVQALNSKISDIMTTEPITLSPEDDLEETVELLIEEKIGGIPVVEGSEGLVGIVTYVDILRCFLHRLQEE